LIDLYWHKHVSTGKSGTALLFLVEDGKQQSLLSALFGLHPLSLIKEHQWVFALKDQGCGVW
jgi:hypothetical protein